MDSLSTMCKQNEDSALRYGIQRASNIFVLKSVFGGKTAVGKMVTVVTILENSEEEKQQPCLGMLVYEGASKVIATLDEDDCNHLELKTLSKEKPGLVKMFKMKVRQLKETVKKANIEKQTPSTSTKSWKQTVLPWATSKAKPIKETVPWQKWLYADPKHSRTVYYNDILPTMYKAAYPHLQSKFQDYLYKERRERYIRKQVLDDLKKKFNFKTSQNDAAYGKFINMKQTPRVSYVEMCERGVKELNKFLKEEINAEEEKIKEKYLTIFDDSGKHLKPWATEQKAYYDEVMEALHDLESDTTEFLAELEKTLTKLRSIFSGLSSGSRKKSRKIKENRRKAKKRRKDRFREGVMALLRRTTSTEIAAKCFPSSIDEPEMQISDIDDLSG
ncbi:uncharacterized protein [Ptychodera flava]|uniref:uncharacterized protein n=1 Tax=Ptychodera flava TaxID=63121 RepID=UPI003969F370